MFASYTAPRADHDDQAFYSAHPSTDPTTGETFNIGIGGSKGSLEISKLSPAGEVVKTSSFIPPANTFWHDNTITEQYLVTVASPFTAPLYSILGALAGFGELGNMYRWNSDAPAQVRSLRLVRCFV